MMWIVCLNEHISLKKESERKHTVFFRDQKQSPGKGSCVIAQGKEEKV